MSDTNTPHQTTASTTTEHEARVAKIEELRSQGIESWPADKPVNASCKQVLDDFKEGQESRLYQVAGRVMIIRHHGKASFAVIQDMSGRLQLYIRQDDIGQELYERFKHTIDIGDIIWAMGHSFKTKMGEITIKVQEYTLLSKSLHPLPEKFHGLTDIETIYRQRYLDLISNQESKERFYKRSLLVRALRTFLNNHGCLEVETPMLHPIPGGAAAKPFVTHHNALNAQLYLRIAPELYLKRLVVGGFERVYEINRNFRNEGVSTRHNPEFTMLELYIAHHDYIFMMSFIEELFKFAVEQVCGSLQVTYGDSVIDFSRPFARVGLQEAVSQYASIREQELTPEKIDATLAKHNITVANVDASHAEKVYALFEKLVEPQLIQPTFITHFPIEVSPLAKRDVQNPELAARFELFIQGMEISNGFNELNDPFDQAERFKAQARARCGGDTEAHCYDADYIQALEYGLPPTAGVGIGIDRLAMLLTNAHSIKDVILFPTLKPKE